MELPELGKHCSDESCKRLDFLPVKCDACSNIYCGTHMNYTSHNCASAYKKNIQVPVCPLCNNPVPTDRGALPDIAVSRHIDNDCRSDQAEGRRKIFTNKCSLKGCRTKEMVPVICTECRKNYCFKHRHTNDHDCGGLRSRLAEAAKARQHNANGLSSRNVHNKSIISSIHGSLTEDEALARAIQLSMSENASNTPRVRSSGQSHNCSIS